jgi:hypothetical protein
MPAQSPTIVAFNRVFNTRADKDSSYRPMLLRQGVISTCKRQIQQGAFLNSRRRKTCACLLISDRRRVVGDSQGPNVSSRKDEAAVVTAGT